jgi:hypothetical protein
VFGCFDRSIGNRELYTSLLTSSHHKSNDSWWSFRRKMVEVESNARGFEIEGGKYGGGSAN